MPAVSKANDEICRFLRIRVHLIKNCVGHRIARARASVKKRGTTVVNI